MGLQFKETMAGRVTTAQGDQDFSFSAYADSKTLFAFGGWSPMNLTGTASLEGVVEGAPLLPGSYLEIGVPLHRYLRYQVSFEDGEGHVYRFFGQKTVRVLDLPKTMTTLEGRLFRDGDELGPATLWFSLLDLPRFLATWRPWSR
ncbi:MAG: hypothetical protein ABI333_06075 [bacterium]